MLLSVGFLLLAPVWFSSHDLIGEFTTNMRQMAEGKGTFEVRIYVNLVMNSVIEMSVIWCIFQKQLLLFSTDKLGVSRIYLR